MIHNYILGKILSVFFITSLFYLFRIILKANFKIYFKIELLLMSKYQDFKHQKMKKSFCTNNIVC